MRQKKFAKMEKVKKSRHITACLEDNEAKDFHQAIQHLQGKSRQSQMPTPCFNEQGDLLVDPEAILEERASYSAKLADDPIGMSKNREHWGTYGATTAYVGPLRIEGATNPLELTRKPVSRPILSLSAFLLAIQSLKKNAVPGKSGLLTSHLKRFIQTEFSLQAPPPQTTPAKRKYGENKIVEPLDYSYKALPQWDLPSKLIKPAFDKLHGIMEACLQLGKLPKLWGEELLISIEKFGLDPRYL
ncbi:hypothetical protein O181_013250 [Austropuccinia psidii MF-1]|uniref:Uncharacterized protein n=1 Tax=Austropuccinia psidii MF-1 TaxID=1389203 RepID=A0A9Q3BZH5_9BASI|nr:hypothetical protein [Austropuccinia psidii MF-1]